MKFSETPEDKTVSVEFIEAPPASGVAQTEKPRPAIKREQLKNQIVEQEERATQDEKPEDARFLSAQNRQVDKETVAKNKGEFKNKKDSKDEKAKKVAGLPSLEKTKGSEAKTKPTLQDLSPEFNPLAIKERQQQKESKQAFGGDHMSADGGDTSQTNDYIKNIQEGAETALNTREFKYYTYYSRIRRQLSQHWEPKVRERLSRLFRQGRNIASDRDHITKLLIVLNNQGTLVKVQVLGESGVRDLDDAAMDAFRSAAPFPNPPKGIVESDGTVKIRWDFVLES